MKSHTFGNMVILSDKSSSRNGVIVNRCYKVMSLLKFLCHSPPLHWVGGWRVEVHLCQLPPIIKESP